MADHTPGPWSVSNGRLIRVITTKRQPLVICGVHRNGIHGGPANGDALANAYMLAASPEMFEALKRARKYVETCDAPDILASIDAALAKAEGR